MVIHKFHNFINNDPIISCYTITIKTTMSTNDLPIEVTHLIAGFLDPKSYVLFTSCCRSYVSLRSESCSFILKKLGDPMQGNSYTHLSITWLTIVQQIVETQDLELAEAWASLFKNTMFKDLLSLDISFTIPIDTIIRGMGYKFPLPLFQWLYKRREHIDTHSINFKKIFGHGFYLRKVNLVGIAIEYNNLPVVKWLLEEGDLLPIECPKNINILPVSRLCLFDHKQLSLMWSNVDSNSIIGCSNNGGIPNHPLLHNIAKLNNNSNLDLPGPLPLLKYLHSKGIQIGQEVCTAAVKGKLLPVVQWIYETKLPKTNNLKHAIRIEDIPIIRFLLEQGTEIKPSSQLAAASLGNIQILQLLHDYNCKWSGKAIEIACKCNVDSVKWLREKGIPWSDKCYGEACKRYYSDVLQYLDANNCPTPLSVQEYCSLAIDCDDNTIEIIRYLHENKGLVITRDLVIQAIKSGDVTIVEYMCSPEYGIVIDEELCLLAMGIEELQDSVVDYLLKFTAVKTEILYLKAIEIDEVEFVKHLHRRGVPWSENVCLAAVKSGRNDIVKYMRKHGCPWNVGLCLRGLFDKSGNCIVGLLLKDLGVTVDWEESDMKKLD